MRTKTQTFRPPAVGTTAEIGSVGEATNGKNAPTALWLKKHWGKPKSIRLASPQSADELWDRDLLSTWCGVIPWIIVPIPLVLPTGREEVVFLGART